MGALLALLGIVGRDATPTVPREQLAPAAERDPAWESRFLRTMAADPGRVNVMIQELATGDGSTTFVERSERAQCTRRAA